MRPDSPRPKVVGPDAGPENPFPLFLSGKVIKGFGRGGKELGIPTANIPIEGLSVGGHEDIESGVYYGWAGLEHLSERSSLNPLNTDTNQPIPDSATFHHPSTKEKVKDAASLAATGVAEVLYGPSADNADERRGLKGSVYPMVMSIGWNPFYKNEKRSVEVHLMHQFNHDFYGARMNLAVLGFIRPEYDYVDRESLVEDIREDIEVARRCLERKAYALFRDSEYLVTFEGKGHDDVAT